MYKPKRLGLSIPSLCANSVFGEREASLSLPESVGTGLPYVGQKWPQAPAPLANFVVVGFEGLPTSPYPSFNTWPLGHDLFSETGSKAVT